MAGGFYMNRGYLGIILALSLLFAGCINAPSSTEETITIAYLPSYHSLPLFVAIEKGMFAEEGLKVNIQRIETPKDIIDGLVAGRIDAGPPSVAAGITTVVESQNPGALKVYALNCGYKGQLVDEILLPPNSTVQSFADLKGKKIGHIPGVQWQTMTKKTLLVNGIDLADVTLVELPLSSQLPTLAANGVDVLFTLEPAGTIGETTNSAKIWKENPFEEYVIDPWCGGAGVLSAKFIQRNPALAKKFVEVMQKAMKETESNIENRNYLIQYLQLPESAVQTVDLPKFIAVGEMDATVIAAYQDFADLFYELDVTQRKIDVRDLFYT